MEQKGLRNLVPWWPVIPLAVLGIVFAVSEETSAGPPFFEARWGGGWSAALKWEQGKVGILDVSARTWRALSSCPDWEETVKQFFAGLFFFKTVLYLQVLKSFWHLFCNIVMKTYTWPRSQVSRILADLILESLCCRVPQNCLMGMAQPAEGGVLWELRGQQSVQHP